MQINQACIVQLDRKENSGAFLEIDRKKMIGSPKKVELMMIGSKETKVTDNR